MDTTGPFEELFADPSAKLALELAREDRKLLADLVEIRRSLGISQAELAAQIGVTQATVSEFERLGNDPRMSTIRRYARALGVMVKHYVDLDGAVASSEDLTHFTADGVTSAPTASAIARRRHLQDEGSLKWRSADAMSAARRQALKSAEASA